MRRLNPAIIQIFGDALIPLLGFFLWNWNLYFILLFYVLDLGTKEVLLHMKSWKVQQHQKKMQGLGYGRTISKEWLVFGAFSFILFLILLFFVQKSMPLLHPSFDYQKEISNFLYYKEWGIEQGYILIPLVVFMGYSQYKMEFLTQKMYEKIDLIDLWKNHLRGGLVLLSCASFSFGMVHLIAIPEWCFVLGIVVLSAAYQLFYGPISKRKQEHR